MYQLENYEKQKKVVQPVKPKKKKYHGWQKFLIIVLIFVISGIVVGNAVSDAIGRYNLNMEEVETLLGYLGEPVVESQLVTDPLNQELSYASFVTKANASGLDIFTEDGISIDADTIALNSDITLTDQEIGAMLNQLFAQGAESFITILQVNITQLPAGYSLLVVAKLNFTTVLEDIQEIVSDFPANIYITTQSSMVISDDQLVIGGTQTTVNQLDSEKNEAVISFLNGLFQSDEQDYSITELIGLLVSETMNDLASKTNSVPQLSNQNITLVVNQAS